MITYIFAGAPGAGGLPQRREVLKKGDLVIGVDGGAQYCREINITPHVLIGDFDSISPDHLQEYTGKGVECISYPRQKNETDLELALDLARERGAKEVKLWGVVGGRWDMSFSNILLAARPGYKNMRLSLFDTACSFEIIHAGKTYTLTDQPGRRISLLPLMGDAEKVTLHGFIYPLQDETLHFGTSRGISNILQQKKATVYLERGILLCIRELTENLVP
ncbi:thiamine diphosphokinase [Desulfomarina sp.]